MIESKSVHDFKNCSSGFCSVDGVLDVYKRQIEERCIFYNVPYRLVGGVNFYQRREIKDILAYLKTIANGVDDPVSYTHLR